MNARVPLLLVLAACGRTELRGPTSESLEPDSAVVTVEDGGFVRPDAGRPDAGATDAGARDAGGPDAGEPDAGEPDAGAPDAGVPDAGVRDAGAPTCPIDLDDTVTVEFSVTADNQRRVWINGVSVEANSNEWYQASSFAVTLRRHPSVENVIAIEATNLSSQAGLDRGVLAQVRLNSQLLITNASWRQRGVLDGGWTAAEPTWKERGFDDRSWGTSVEQAPNGGGPWGLVQTIDPRAQWLWPYLSSTPLKPNVEPVLFRKSVYVTRDGGLSEQPTSCF